MNPTLVAVNVALVLGLMTVLWLVSVRMKDASIVDPWWSINFLLVTCSSMLQTGFTPAKSVLLVMVAVWAIRLWLYLLLRSIGHPEDPRYAAFRERFGRERYWWFSFFQVFMLQGGLALVIASPLVWAAAAGPPDNLSATDMVGLGLFVIGFLFEAIGDNQLRAFRADPTNKGRILDTGLWRYTRHPNYFGECVLWWGFWLCAVDQPWGWVTVFAPILMTFLLLRVSGVSMLDEHMTRTRPAYADYVKRTSAFIPRPPRDHAS